MTDGPDEEPDTSGLPGGGVEPPKVAASKGGWVGRETAGRAPGVDHDRSGVDDREAADWKRARELADGFPRWSDEEWREVNATLGYRIASVAGRRKRESADRDGTGASESA